MTISTFLKKLWLKANGNHRKNEQKTIENLIANYNDFHDALLVNFEYKTNIDFSDKSYKKRINEINLIISCFNIVEEVKRETIKINFLEIEKFKYTKFEGMIFEILVQKENDFTIVDFDPIILGHDETGKFILEINPNSYLQIKFKNLFYEVIE
ncbi:hypothetical protein ACLI09_17080 [Flavobacterium sp. RHBU_24]|uniref:hypothetical protein n=1 Tax=Flavobacterium sp. RHBU_24 TaxID=3391185 RepID=UPI0039848E2E